MNSSSDQDYPLEIELAVQGGGARLRTLTAALEAFQDSEDIAIKKLVGTSAGAVASMLYAAKVPMGDVLEWMSEQNWRDVLPPRKASGLRARSAHYLLSLIIRLIAPATHTESKLLGICIGNAVLGHSLFNVDVFRERLVQFISDKSPLVACKHGRIDRLTLAEFNEATDVDLLIVRTDMINGVAEYASLDDKVLDAVIDSIAIPYALRNVRDSVHRLDGGICANLAADYLTGPLRLAIGFKEDQRRLPNNPFSLGIALLSTAIDSAVGGQISRLGAENTLRLTSDYSTFDFPRLFRDVSDTDREIQNTDAKRAYQDASFWLDGWVAKSRAELELDGDPWAIATNGSDLAARSLKRRLEELSSLAEERCAIHEYDIHFRLEFEQTQSGSYRVGAIVSESRVISHAKRPVPIGFVMPTSARILPGFDVTVLDLQRENFSRAKWIPALEPGGDYQEGMHRLFLVDLSDSREKARVTLTYRASDYIQQLFSPKGEEFLIKFARNSLRNTRAKIMVSWPKSLGALECVETWVPKRFSEESVDDSDFHTISIESDIDLTETDVFGISLKCRAAG